MRAEAIVPPIYDFSLEIFWGKALRFDPSLIRLLVVSTLHVLMPLGPCRWTGGVCTVMWWGSAHLLSPLKCRSSKGEFEGSQGHTVPWACQSAFMEEIRRVKITFLDWKLIEAWQTPSNLYFHLGRDFSYELNYSGRTAKQKITPSVYE